MFDKLPLEVRFDIVGFLDRLGVERFTFASRATRNTADHLLDSGKAPIRFIERVKLVRRQGSDSLEANSTDSNRRNGWFFAFSSEAYTFELLIALVRWAKVKSLSFTGSNKVVPATLSISSWNRFMSAIDKTQATTISFVNLNICSIPPSSFAQILSFDGLRNLHLEKCLMLAAQLDNNFLRRFPVCDSEDTHLLIWDTVPCDRATFNVSDTGILDFAFAASAHVLRRLGICCVRTSVGFPRTFIQRRLATLGIKKRNIVLNLDMQEGFTRTLRRLGFDRVEYENVSTYARVGVNTKFVEFGLGQRNSCFAVQLKC